MRKHALLSFFVVLFGSFTSQLFAQHTITNWPDNKRGAVSITFDDGVTSHLTVAMPALFAHGMRGTFFVLTDGVTARKEWVFWMFASLFGHEIGSHTKSHPYLTFLNPDELRKELSESKAAIDRYIPFQNCLTLAYPFGVENPDVQAAAAGYYIAARNTQGGVNSGDVNFMSVNGDGDDFNPLADMKTWADIAERDGKWQVAIFHGLDGSGYSFYNRSTFNGYLDHLASKSLWVATFGDAVKFIKERDSANLSVVKHKKSQIKLSLSDSLDNHIYDQPLTIRSEVPADWETVDIDQRHRSVRITPVVENGIPVVYYEAVPDRGLITLAPASKGH